MNELDTEGIQPQSHVFPIHNVFREDEVLNGPDRDSLLQNAPAKKDGCFMVPKTVE
jgi:aspartyl-tRNA(Asn)/glutamyl-tRNA(Gln) amidotransferase subunit C